MTNEKENSLLLYINETEPILVYIFDDKAIKFGNDEYYECFMESAFHFLIGLYENEWTRKAFPKRLQRHFEEIAKKQLKFLRRLCFCGTHPGTDFGNLNCLVMRMMIDLNSAPNIVKLSDFAFVDDGTELVGDSYLTGAKVANIQGEILLTAEEALILFGNINVMKFGLDDRFSWVSSPLDFDAMREKIFGKKGILNKPYLLSEPNLTATDHGTLYCIDYIEHLIHQLTEGNISPEKVLQLSGAKMLAILANVPVVYSFIETCIKKLQEGLAQLSRNLKIQYYLLFKFMRFSYREKDLPFKDFLQKNESLLQQLEEELTQLPMLLSFKRVEWKELYSKYG